MQRPHSLLRPSHSSLLHGHEPHRRLRLLEGLVRADGHDSDEERDLQRHQRLLHQAENAEADGARRYLQRGRAASGAQGEQASASGVATRISCQL